MKNYLERDFPTAEAAFQLALSLGFEVALSYGRCVDGTAGFDAWIFGKDDRESLTGDDPVEAGTAAGAILLAIEVGQKAGAQTAHSST
jgi:hypothetical protein